MSPKAAVRPPNHGVLLHTDKEGAPCISLTRASKRSRRKPGRYITTLKGLAREIAYPHIATILHNEEDIRLNSERHQYSLMDETTAAQVRLAMLAVRKTSDTEQAQRLGKIVADMDNAEARWWHAHLRDRNRPSNIVKAMALVWG